MNEDVCSKKSEKKINILINEKLLMSTTTIRNITQLGLVK